MDTINTSATAPPRFSAATPDVPYDVVCIGFGPAALSLAIGLVEQTRPLNILFLERRSEFSWRGEDMLLGQSRMRTTLIQDLVTQRNPLSKFTFVNFLWTTDNLIAYTNLSLVNPPRQLFAQYLAWCAAQIQEKGCVQFGEEAKSVESIRQSNGLVDLWRITHRNAVSGAVRLIQA